MTEAERRRAVAQLLVIRASGHAEDRQRQYPHWEHSNGELQRLLQSGVGGVILLGGTATELQQRCRTLRSWSDSGELLLCADVEEGIGQRFPGATWLAPPMALGRLHQTNPEHALRLAERYGRTTGDQAQRCGLNWVLAPVCDVNSNPDNPVINVRAWGDQPESVADLVRAFQRGLNAAGVLGCAKHFPGHGDTDQDSHLELPLIKHGRSRLDRVELVPFRRLIDSGIASVMTAHLLIPALDDSQPATLSRAVLTDLLRTELGFTGLVVTDALVMEAISNRAGPGEAAVQAFAAGADLILMPADADAAIDALCTALADGRISESRLHDSLKRRTEALQGCEKPSATAIATTPEIELETATDRRLCMELIDSSLEVQGPQLPTQPAQNGVTLIRVDGVLPCRFLCADAAAISTPERHGYKALICHDRGIEPWSTDKDPTGGLDLERLGPGPVFLQLFLRGNPFRAGQQRHEPWAEAIEQLLRVQRLCGLAVYGCPYRWDSLRKLIPDSIAAGYSPGQMPEAQQQLLNRMWGFSSEAHQRQDFTD
ncbi:putative lipoprotein YbbD precursor [Synechococcus sp. MIT S9509]|uniref:glycoside hydrolase family 3 N-terminal domain-containing protein n=1 Tax=Synechococcus sp. MIT S9509 TaxID=1801630 RepID=UPI0007BBC295|nr:glycoside hydrolase family 3 N-terminal domain-containing protein [Synechococcus sp. MIT S9509]KZR88646.1 putative lipoprotein YbbD precursor [Synechococcus sp. MIT S9509]